eukprot:7127324-Lingulodinium_polyedra.AAC.1
MERCFRVSIADMEEHGFLQMHARVNGGRRGPRKSRSNVTVAGHGGNPDRETRNRACWGLKLSRFCNPNNH